MGLITWIRNKHEKVSVSIDTFFESEDAKERLQSIYVYPIICSFFSNGNDYQEMQNRLFTSPEEVLICLELYQDIIAKINYKTVFVPTIENFCMWMGWTATIYKQMLTDTHDDIKQVMQMINDYIIESQLSAGQSGFAKATLTKFRSQLAGEHGNNLVTQKEQNEENRAKGIKSKEQLIKELQGFGFSLPNSVDKQ